MGILVKQGGVWRDSDPSVRQGGVWRPGDQGFVRQGDVWREVYASLVAPAAGTNNTAEFVGAWSSWVYIARSTVVTINLWFPNVTIRNDGLSGTARMVALFDEERSTGFVDDECSWSTDFIINPSAQAAHSCPGHTNTSKGGWRSFSCTLTSGIMNAAGTALFQAKMNNYYNYGPGASMRWRVKARMMTVDPYPAWTQL